MLRDGLDGSAVDLGGADAVTGPELATELAAVLDRPVRYVPQEADEFRAGLARVVEEASAAGVADTYRWLATEAEPALLASSGAEGKLGVRPGRLRDWNGAQPWDVLAGAAR